MTVADWVEETEHFNTTGLRAPRGGSKRPPRLTARLVATSPLGTHDIRPVSAVAAPTLAPHQMLQLKRLGEALGAAMSRRDDLPPLSLAVVTLAWDTMRDVVPGDERFVPYVIPTYDAGLQLDWPLPQVLIEIQITPDGERFVNIETSDGQTVYDGEYAGQGRLYVEKELIAARDAK